MPELPEVETIRRQLEPRLVRRRITGVEVYDPLLTAPTAPEEFADALTDQLITCVDRRGKYLLVGLESGATLALHLRMTGRLHWRAGSPAPGEERFLRAVLVCDDGSTVTFADVRRFGRAWVMPAAVSQREFWAQRLGVDALSDAFTARGLAESLRGRRVAVKTAVLNQRLLAGVGNIYADEALFAARVHPLRPAGSLTTHECRVLRGAIRARLEVAIAAGGASIDTYRDALGQRGRMQDLLQVHLHEGDPCPRCGAIIVKSVVGQRGTYWCPRCQPDTTGSAVAVARRRPRSNRSAGVI